MTEKDRVLSGERARPILVFLLTLIICLSLVKFGFYSVDEESYTYLTKSIALEGRLDFRSDYPVTGSDLHRAHYSVVSDGRIYSVFPPGYPLLAAPFYKLFGIKGMQIANIFFTALLTVLFYYFVKHFYPETTGFLWALLPIVATQMLNYSVSQWSHIPAALFILLGFYTLFKGRPALAGVAIGLAITTRYTAVVPLIFFLPYQYTRNRRKLPLLLAGALVGVLPLLTYNTLAFGSPFTSAMTILNTEIGLRTFSLSQLPKALVTNIVHYTFFPELEYPYFKFSLIETSSFLVFGVVGARMLWNEKKHMRAETATILASIAAFIIFISGTWSLGGQAHNMRLLTDIVPLITFLAIIPILQLNLNRRVLLAASVLLAAALFLLHIPLAPVKLANLVIALASLISILWIVSFRKKYTQDNAKKAVTSLLIIGIGLSIFTSVSTTIIESTNRRGNTQAASVFETLAPEGSVVLLFGGKYPSYTEKSYIFLDYSQSTADIPRVLEYYRNRPRYVLLYGESHRKFFTGFNLSAEALPGLYKISEAE